MGLFGKDIILPRVPNRLCFYSFNKITSRLFFNQYHSLLIFTYLNKIQLPGYVKYLLVLAGILLTIHVLIVAKSIFSPIFTAFVLALLLHPLSRWVERFRIPRGISSVLSIVIVFVVLFGLFYFFSAQIRNISGDLAAIEDRFNEVIDRGHLWMEETFGVEQQEQTIYLKDSLNGILRNSTTFLSRTASATAGFFTAFFLVLITLFFFLYYRRFLVDFIYQLFDQSQHRTVGHTIIKAERVIRSYILGLLTVIVIVAVLNTAGLMILGIEHAMFFGVLAAVLTVIPYIGIFIGSLLPIIFALVTKDSLWYPVGVALIFWGVQFLEGNFITPNVIGSSVSINPFAAIIALFFGGIIWGPIGMILSIPILAIIKVICDAVPSLHPYGFLLGNPPDEDEARQKKRKRILRKKKQDTPQQIPEEVL